MRKNHPKISRRIGLFAAVILAGALSTSAPVIAEDDTPDSSAPAIATSTCSAYPQLTCTSSDALACADILQLGIDTRQQLAELLQLGPTWRFPVHIHVMTADDPLLAKIDHEQSATYAKGGTMGIEAVLPSTDPYAREFIQRQFVTALLWEKFFAKTTSFDQNTKLDVIPVWLAEGLRESLNDDEDHDRESIVRRAVQNQSAPTLTEITSWRELSNDRLLGLWQRAFSFYLVESLTQTGERRDDFQQWLDGISGSGSSTASLHFPTEAAWQRELADATTRSRAIVYTWAETESELADTETITFANSKDAKVQTCTLDTVARLPRTPALVEALKERVFLLTALELRAHSAWQPTLVAYCSALTALVAGTDPAQAGRLFAHAHKLRVAETSYHQKLLDYLNWFEVTKDTSGNMTHFQAYFSTAREMERIQADPAHPNPIRANLLQIESKL